MRLEWSAADEAFRGELVEFLEQYAPTEAKAGRDFTEGGGFEIPAWAREGQSTPLDHGCVIPAYPPALRRRYPPPPPTPGPEALTRLPRRSPCPLLTPESLPGHRLMQ